MATMLSHQLEGVGPSLLLVIECQEIMERIAVGDCCRMPTGRVARVGRDRVWFGARQATVVLGKLLQNIYRVWFLAALMYGYSSIYIDDAVDRRRNAVHTVDLVVHSVKQRRPGEIHLLDLLIRLHGAFVNISGHVLAVGRFAEPGVSADPVPGAVTSHVDEDKLELVLVLLPDFFQTPRLEVERRSCRARQRQRDRLFAAEVRESDRAVSDRPNLLAGSVLLYGQHRQIEVRRLNAWLEPNA